MFVEAWAMFHICVLSWKWQHLGPFLQTWIDFNPSVDKQLHPL